MVRHAGCRPSQCTAARRQAWQLDWHCLASGALPRCINEDVTDLTLGVAGIAAESWGRGMALVSNLTSTGAHQDAWCHPTCSGPAQVGWRRHPDTSQTSPSFGQAAGAWQTGTVVRHTASGILEATSLPSDAGSILTDLSRRSCPDRRLSRPGLAWHCPTAGE